MNGPRCKWCGRVEAEHPSDFCGRGFTPREINLAQQNRAITLSDRALCAHLSSGTPTVKSGKTRILSFNRALAAGRFGKSADPTCYNVSVGGNHAAALFDIARN